MQLIVGQRQSGRTTALIKAAAESEAKGEVCYIVCHNHQEAYRISKQAEEMGLNIGFPLTYDEFLGHGYHGEHISRFYIDNLFMLVQSLSKVPIEAVVW